jgi:hypothetical protein
MIATLIKAAALTAMLAVTGTAAGVATSTAASAQSIEFRFGAPSGSRYHHAPRYARDFCDPRQAVSKASRMGLRRAHVVRHAPRRVAVQGYHRGHQSRIVFANQRGCPVIGHR